MTQFATAWQTAGGQQVLAVRWVGDNDRPYVQLKTAGPAGRVALRLDFDDDAKADAYFRDVLAKGDARTLAEKTVMGAYGRL